MKTRKFKASAVLKQGQGSTDIFSYPGGIKTERKVKVLMHEVGKVNYFLSMDCNFMLYTEHNPSIVFGDNNLYIVENPNQQYEVIAFLEKSNDNELENPVCISTTLPIGLEMTRQRAIEKNKVFCFSGLNLMLFEEEPQFPH